MRSRMLVGVAAVIFEAVGGCTERNPAYCANDAECGDPAKPYCDIAGEFEESGFDQNTCIPRPQGCSVERCGCEPGAGLSCDLAELSICNSDGHSTSLVSCPLGCSTENRCLAFEPTNGLVEALADSAVEPAVVVPPGSTIDTDIGRVMTPTGEISVTSRLITQESGNTIRVLLARAFDVDDVVVVGSSALAIVAHESISVRGRMDASANGRVAGPGGQEAPAVCAGADTMHVTATQPLIWNSIAGPGGGGNATNGGDGGGWSSPSGPGGSASIGFVPLVGGCRGGSSRSVANAVLANGGGGGGAVQLVAGREISFVMGGLIDVGGGGGEGVGTALEKFSGAGGSGGLVILEAPLVTMNGAATGIAANGGAGGSCNTAGADGSPNNLVALGPVCAESTAGDGGTGTVLPTGKLLPCENCMANFQHLDGGGGAAGRVRIATRDGTVEQTGSPTMSAVVSTEPLTLR